MRTRLPHFSGRPSVRLGASLLLLACLPVAAMDAQGTDNPGQVAPSATEQDSAALASLLRAKDEALLAAVHNGGRRVWEDATAPDFMYVEEGGVQTRADFLKDLETAGSGPLRIKHY